MAPIFLLDKRMLVVETSPGFYVCFRCGIVVLQAVKKLLVVHYFGACLFITGVPLLITETVLPSDPVGRYHCHSVTLTNYWSASFRGLS